jgi:hypothetical protein
VREMEGNFSGSEVIATHATLLAASKLIAKDCASVNEVRHVTLPPMCIHIICICVVCVLGCVCVCVCGGCECVCVCVCVVNVIVFVLCALRVYPILPSSLSLSLSLSLLLLYVLSHHYSYGIPNALSLESSYASPLTHALSIMCLIRGACIRLDICTHV